MSWGLRSQWSWVVTVEFSGHSGVGLGSQVTVELGWGPRSQWSWVGVSGYGGGGLRSQVTVVSGCSWGPQSGSQAAVGVSGRSRGLRPQSGSQAAVGVSGRSRRLRPQLGVSGVWAR